MSCGNNVFVSAQNKYSIIKAARTNVKFNDSLIELCYTSITEYLELLLNRANLQKRSSLLETVSFLSSCGILLSNKAIVHAAFLQAMRSIGHTDDVTLLHRMVHSYIELRASILTYLLENYVPVWQDGKAYHSVTGIGLRAKEYSYQYTFEEYYEI